MLLKMTHDPAYSSWTPRRKQEQRYRAASLQEQGFHHRPTGDPVHYSRQASDFQLLARWFSPDQEAGPCHVCSRAVGMDAGRSVSRFQPGSGLTASAPVLDVPAPACTNGAWPPLQPVSVAQNKQSTMLSSNVQSIDHPMDCTTLTMIQSNGCTTPAPRSSAA